MEITGHHNNEALVVAGLGLKLCYIKPFWGCNSEHWGKTFRFDDTLWYAITANKLEPATDVEQDRKLGTTDPTHQPLKEKGMYVDPRTCFVRNGRV